MSIAISTGTFSTFASISSGVGSKVWQNPSGPLNGGGDPAYSDLGVSGKSDYLRALGASFYPSIPSYPTLVIDGIEFIVRKWQSPAANIKDSHVYLFRDSTMSTNVDGVVSTPYWPETATEFSYGGPTSLWGRTNWNMASLVSGFGVAFQAKTGTDGETFSTAYVDKVYTKIYMSVPDSVEVTLTASPSSGASPLPVNFSCAVSGGTGPYTYDWLFGDGSSYSNGGPSLSHTYTSVGSYLVQVTVTPTVGGVGTATTTVVVTGSSTLVAVAAFSPATGASPLTVNFVSTVTGGTAPYTYAWNFGDSGTSTLEDPTHTYTVGGTYTPTLLVTDAANNNTQAVGLSQIVVTPGVLTVTASGSPLTGQVPLGVNFAASAINGTAPYTFSWNFGDGSPTSPLQNPSHSYITSGVYNSVVTCLDSAGNTASNFVQIHATTSTPLTVSISATPVSGASPLSVAFTSSATGGTAPYSYEWVFGDLLTDATANPTHIYYPGTYYASLKLRDAVMPVGQYITSNTIVITATGSGSGVSGTITVDQVTGEPPLPVLCTASGSGGTVPYSYIWGFGDGSAQSTDAVVTHTYTTIGSYLLSLRVEDSVGLVGFAPPVTITVTDAITPGGSGDAYLSWVGLDDQTPTGDLLFSYYLSPLESSWGAWVSDTSHTYIALAGGSYTFHVRCKDSSGLISTEDTCSFDWSGGGFITAYIQEDIHYSTSIPTTINFIGSAVGGVPPYVFSWDFGDLTATGSGSTISHTYTASGEFQVVLTVTDSASGSTTATATKYIGVTGYSVSGIIENYGRGPLTYIKGNQSVGSVGWENKPDAVMMDGVGAYVTLSNGVGSYYLVCKVLAGTDVPTGTSLSGLEVFVHRMATGTITDKRIAPIKNGTIFGGVDHSKPDPNPWAATWEWVTYGGPTDLWGFDSFDSTQLTTKDFGIAIQAEGGSGGGTGRVDAVLVKPYYGGMPTYPLGVGGIVVEAAPPDSLDLGMVGTTEADGTYSIGPLFDGHIYTVEPNYGTGDETQGWGFIPEAQDITISTADVIGVDFEAFRAFYPFVRKNHPGVSGTIIPGSTFVWKYYYTKSKSTQSFKILVKNISGGDVDLYVSKNSLPDEEDYDYRSSSPGATEEKVVFYPPSGVTYWFIGIRCMTMGTSLPISYKIVVTQPPA